MLTEHFIASEGPPTNDSVVKDDAIFVHEFQPLSAQRASLKKSATPPKCLAASETHVFAAQADKAVVHVYGRDKGNQQSTIPFPERISAITLACNASVLLLGTNEGRIFAWELYSGRQVSTAQVHLQAVTSLAVDSSSNFLLSSSKDSTVHVWSLPNLLSFVSIQNITPLRTFSAHSSEITAMIIAHSASHCNFAVSSSQDRVCLLWDYHTGNVLRTYLLPYIPRCLALDPADRAVYVGYENGNVQQLNLFLINETGLTEAVLHGKYGTDPIQPSPSSSWALPDLSNGSALSIDVSFDGTTILTGHQSGSVVSWDAPRGCFLADQIQTPLPGPVNNLSFLPVSGFRGGDSRLQRYKVQAAEIVKPKFGAFNNSESWAIPGNYTINVHFLPQASLISSMSAFWTALTAPSFPVSMLSEELASLADWESSSASRSDGQLVESASDYMALDSKSPATSLQEENTSLKLELESLRRAQMKSLQGFQKLNDEKRALLRREQQRLVSRQRQRTGVSVDCIDDEITTEDDSG